MKYPHHNFGYPESCLTFPIIPCRFWTPWKWVHAHILPLCHPKPWSIMIDGCLMNLLGPHGSVVQPGLTKALGHFRLPTDQRCCLDGVEHGIWLVVHSIGARKEGVVSSINFEVFHLFFCLEPGTSKWSNNQDSNTEMLCEGLKGHNEPFLMLFLAVEDSTKCQGFET